MIKGEYHCICREERYQLGLLYLTSAEALLDLAHCTSRRAWKSVSVGVARSVATRFQLDDASACCEVSVETRCEGEDVSGLITEVI